MTIIAKCPVELNGHIYHKGEKCTYDGDLTDRIRDNFEVEGATDDSSPDHSSPDHSSTNHSSTNYSSTLQLTVKAMGREGIKRALDAMNVTYSPNAKTDYLARLLLVSRGEMEDTGN